MLEEREFREGKNLHLRSEKISEFFMELIRYLSGVT